MTNPTTPQATVQNTWTIADIDEITETLNVLHRLNIPYTLTFTGDIYDIRSPPWSLSTRLTGDVVPTIAEQGEA